MIRVLHIVGKMDRAGAETMLMNLYRHIDRTQVQFDFITFTQEKGDYDDEILTLGGKIYPILASNPLERMYKLAKFLKNHPEYQIVHAHMLLSNAFHLLAAKYAGVYHRISHSHNTSSRKVGYISKIYERFSIYLNRILPTKKIACGEKAAEYLFSTTENVLLLNNAIDLKSYNEISLYNKNYWEKNFLDNGGVKIIQVGRLNEVKNHSFSLEIAKKLKDQNFNFIFFIVGQGPLEDLIRKKIEDYDLNRNVFLLGVREDVPNLMAGADIMLMPSLHEGFPVVLVESQAIGLKSIISSNISKEVDLGVNLVDFKDLTNVDAWVKEVKFAKHINIDIKNKIQVLAKCGFDIRENASTLLKLYKSMENKFKYVN